MAQAPISSNRKDPKDSRGWSRVAPKLKTPNPYSASVKLDKEEAVRRFVVSPRLCMSGQSSAIRTPSSDLVLESGFGFWVRQKIGPCIHHVALCLVVS